MITLNLRLTVKNAFDLEEFLKKMLLHPDKMYSITNTNDLKFTKVFKEYQLHNFLPGLNLKTIMNDELVSINCYGFDVDNFNINQTLYEINEKGRNLTFEEIVTMMKKVSKNSVGIIMLENPLIHNTKQLEELIDLGLDGIFLESNYNLEEESRCYDISSKYNIYLIDEKNEKHFFDLNPKKSTTK